MKTLNGNTVSFLISETIPKDIQTEITRWLRDVDPLDLSDTLYDTFGNDIFVIEAEEELSKVQGLHRTDREKFYQELDKGPASFDICEKVGEGNYILCVLMTNNSGGPAYFIPKDLWTPNVLASVDIDGKTP